MRPLFVYKRNVALAKSALDRIRKAGYTPIGVDSFDDVKIVDGSAASLSGNSLFLAAIRTILMMGSRQQDFGEIAARMLEAELSSPALAEAEQEG